MDYFIGLDVSQRRTAVCIVDVDGKVAAEGSAITSPSEIYHWIEKHIEIKAVRRVGLEAGAMSFWLHTELADRGLPMVCLEAFQAAQLLKTQRNKTDKNDARGLAQIIRLGGRFLRTVEGSKQIEPGNADAADYASVHGQPEDWPAKQHYRITEAVRLDRPPWKNLCKNVSRRRPVNTIAW